MVPEKPKPEISAFLVCDYVIIDAVHGKKSAIGIFNDIICRAFPAMHGRLFVLAVMSDIPKMETMRLELVNLKTSEVLGFAEGPAPQVTDRLETVEFVMELTNVVFPDDGKHVFRLYCDGSVVVEKTFNVCEAPVRSEGDEQ